jgi:hypothetical protein
MKMSYEDLGLVSTMLFRLQSEIERQSGIHGPAWSREAHEHVEWTHGIVLALMAMSGGLPEYSVRALA